jgi:peroxisomal enoyl-CoA hydratase 2
MEETTMERIKKMIGQEFYRIEGYPVEKGKIREFSMAIMEDNPIFYDDQSAKQEGFRSIPAPLTYSQTLSFWNRNKPPLKILGLDRRYILHGGQEYEYFKPIVAGDILTAVCKLEDVYAKVGSRGGKMLFVVLKTEFFDQQSSLVLSYKQILIQTKMASNK